jgi:hypothetical protein
MLSPPPRRSQERNEKSKRRAKVKPAKGLLKILEARCPFLTRRKGPIPLENLKAKQLASKRYQGYHIQRSWEMELVDHVGLPLYKS